MYTNDHEQNGTKVASVGADKSLKICDLSTQQTMSIQAHEQPIRAVRYFETNGQEMLATGSWDKKIKFWDLRSSNAVLSVDCQERVYTMDARDNLLVVGTADRYINIINLKEPQKFYKQIQSPLKWQTRVVSCFTDAAGFAIGSIEGRCAIQYVEEKDAKYVTDHKPSPCPLSRPATMKNACSPPRKTTAPTSPSSATVTPPKAT